MVPPPRAAPGRGEVLAGHRRLELWVSWALSQMADTPALCTRVPAHVLRLSGHAVFVAQDDC